jgi:hypothetical protein
MNHIRLGCGNNLFERPLDASTGKCVTQPAGRACGKASAAEDLNAILIGRLRPFTGSRRRCWDEDGCFVTGLNLSLRNRLGIQLGTTDMIWHILVKNVEYAHDQSDSSSDSLLTAD